MPASNQTRYANDPNGPILLITGNAIFELLDEFDPATGDARLAASRDGFWFHVGGENFMTWTYADGRWTLGVEQQYLA